MLWFRHGKYTHEYVTRQMAEINDRVGRETRRMVLVASASVALMVAVQAVCLYDIAGR
ncbi:hypothetical protein GKC30_08340 [Pseudodesulfovibrio sp. F-1]|uniref:Uncharacterized protein n=1 Tax=Pseudodesulfovibrio alkaliphilus TaxID=2661613 RepID=A0A7K1KNH4_9BACT|nr:hypothetical protein [Pseudodesulfovibrio alkaliphilus]MUM77639.1 hypothetical protein [Pseudodesulfovibrio alkaliphilus]